MSRATLAGTLNVSEFGGFDVTASETFPVLTYTSRMGDFTTENGLDVGGGVILQKQFGAGGLDLVATASSTSAGTLPAFALAGDYNGDGMVNTVDYTLYRNSLGGIVAPYSGADGNGNGVVDQGDHDLWRANYGLSSFAGTATRRSAEGSSLTAAQPNDTALSAAIDMALAKWANTRTTVARPRNQTDQPKTQELVRHRLLQLVGQDSADRNEKRPHELHVVNGNKGAENAITAAGDMLWDDWDLRLRVLL